MNDLSLSLSRLIPAPCPRVYDAWLDPKMLARFMIACDGMGVSDARTEARVGGTFLIVMHLDGRDIPHYGTYLDLQPYSLIRFTWASVNSMADSEVTLTFMPEGDGTRVNLTHVKFADEAARANHVGGWGSILNALAAVF